ncbi:MAG: nucleoside deaminase [Bacteroidota bacterium]
MSTEPNKELMVIAANLAEENVLRGTGGPFGALIVRNGEIVAQAANNVIAGNDPTAHAEVEAIRAACRKLETFDLSGCEIYTSCEPCPMCLSAIYWARLDKIYYAGTRHDAAAIGFDDEHIYQELALPMDKREVPIELLWVPEVVKGFRAWMDKEDRTRY